MNNNNEVFPKTEVYLVGGAVRDSILNRKTTDKDYVVVASGGYNQMKEYFRRRGGEIFLEKPQYLTFRGRGSFFSDTGRAEAADFTLARKESFYNDCRHPESVAPGCLADDLARRDFTINSLAQNIETKEITDLYGGQEDIKNKIIRCVGNPVERFEEDRLRILRALRFSVVLSFDIDTKTKHAIQKISRWETEIFRGVSQERIVVELTKMFQHDTLSTLELLHKFPKIMKEAFRQNKNKQKIWLLPTTKV